MCKINNEQLEGILWYSDVDFAGDIDRKRSTTRYVFTLFGIVFS